IPGFRSIDLIRRQRDHDVEFVTLMWFETLDSVKAFTGEDYEAAHVPAHAQPVLADFDRRAAHHKGLDPPEQALRYRSILRCRSGRKLAVPRPARARTTV